MIIKQKSNKSKIIRVERGIKNILEEVRKIKTKPWGDIKGVFMNLLKVHSDGARSKSHIQGNTTEGSPA